MPSLKDVASQLGLPGGARKLPCLTSDWETSLSSPEESAHQSSWAPVPEEMIERVIRYSTNEQLQSRKTNAVNKG
jgi:hypothetical protein